MQRLTGRAEFCNICANVYARGHARSLRANSGDLAEEWGRENIDKERVCGACTLLRGSVIAIRVRIIFSTCCC